MAAPSLTYTLTNSATADASQVMQNYNDLLNGITDGTKDLTINAFTVNGAASFKGAVTLGDATADDITHTGSLASTIPIKTNNSFDIGSSTLGLSGVYLGNGGAGATCRLISASHATTRTYSFPDAGAAANVVLSEATATINGVKTFAGQLIGKGTATNDTAAAGYIGECVQTTNSAVSLSNGGQTTVVTLAIPSAGDWDVSGILEYDGSGISDAGTNAYLSSISTTTNTIAGNRGYPDGSYQVRLEFFPTALTTTNAHFFVSFSSYQVLTSGALNLYLVANPNFTAGTMTGAGFLTARRRR